MTEPFFTMVEIEELRRLDSPNPNVMDPRRFELLKKGMESEGFLQAILVVQDGDDFVLVDGEHRVRAAMELEYQQVPAMVCPNLEKARLLRIALNKLRGELDLTMVGSELLELYDAGVDVDMLTLTGFDMPEVESLLDRAQGDNEDDLLAGTNVSMEDMTEKPKTFNLTLKFETESARARVKEMLSALDEDPATALRLLLESN